MSKPASDRSPALLSVCAALVILGALYLGRSLFAPMCISIFIVAIAWPLQRAMERRMPRVVAMVATVVATDEWLEERGLYLLSDFVENFDPSWWFGVLQTVGFGLRQVASFVVIALVFVVLGLLEVDTMRRKLERANKTNFVDACRAAASSNSCSAVTSSHASRAFGCRFRPSWCCSRCSWGAWCGASPARSSGCRC